MLSDYFKVFATSEPLGNETNIHRRTDDHNLLHAKRLIDPAIVLISSCGRSGSLLHAVFRPITSAIPATSTP